MTEPFVLVVPCASCGKQRSYNKYEVKRGRISELCQPCSMADYWKDKPKRSKEDIAKYQREYSQRKKKELAEYYSDYRLKLKEEMVDEYGGCCQECGEDDVIVLVLDHVFDNAQEDRIVNNHNGGYKMYMRLKQQGWPQEGYQLLCHNCNYRKEFFRRRNAVFQCKAG